MTPLMAHSRVAGNTQRWEEHYGKSIDELASMWRRTVMSR
jgi:hypothetical protein